MHRNGASSRHDLITIGDRKQKKREAEGRGDEKTLKIPRLSVVNQRPDFTGREWYCERVVPRFMEASGGHND